MKNPSFPRKSFLKGCLLALSVTGCIKEPGPDIPPPAHKPAWLLAKFIEVTAYGDPILGPVYGEFYYDKRVTEYRYDQHYKPSLKLVYIAPAQGDTVNLQLASRDTLIYDRLLRVTQVRTINRTNTVISIKKFSYQANDTLPASLETAYYDANGAPARQYNTRYEYWGDTAVLAISPGSKGYDSVKFMYNAGNYMRQCTASGFCTDKYMNHIGANVGLFLNLSHGLALDIPETDESPRISHGNWQNKEYYDQFRSITFNEQGLVVRTGWTNYNPEYSVSSRFEYIKVE